MPSIAQWKLRRLATRALRVHERRAGQSKALAAFETTLVPIAKEFIAAYDDVKRFNAKWQLEMREGRGAVADLTRVLRRWLPRLAVDIPHFARSTFADTAVPDDVMEDADRLHDTVLEHQELAAEASSTLKPLAYANDLLGELEPAYTAALKEWREAEVADSRYQQGLANARRLAGQLQQELVAFRETLGGILGRSDTDYQKLRIARAAKPDVEDDPNAPAPASETPSDGASSSES